MARDVLLTTAELAYRASHPSENGEAMNQNTQKSSTTAIAANHIPISCTMPLGWYAAYTAPRHEKRVAEHFAQRHIEAFLPLYQSRRHWKDGSKKIIALPLFPGYIFVRINREEILKVLQVPGVLSLVCFGAKPALLPDSEIESLRSGLAAGNAEPHDYLADGERVRIVGGPFAGMEGFLERSDFIFRVVVRFERIMKSFAVQIDPCDLEILRANNGWHLTATVGAKA